MAFPNWCGSEYVYTLITALTFCSVTVPQRGLEKGLVTLTERSRNNTAMLIGRIMIIVRIVIVMILVMVIIAIMIIPRTLIILIP